MPTKKKTKTKKYKVVDISRIAGLGFSENAKEFWLEGVTSSGDSDNYPCSIEVYRALESDKVASNYRVNFKLHIDADTELVERITASPKTEYQAYQVEYADSIELPKKEVFSAP
tara:strand:- start:181 stop:522 length:342 start_codon:yes stop_codon:yes gene_type:complete